MPSAKITVIIFLPPVSICHFVIAVACDNFLYFLFIFFLLKCRSFRHNIQTKPAVQTIQSDLLRLNSNIHSRRPSGTSFNISGASSQTREEKERMKSVKEDWQRMEGNEERRWWRRRQRWRWGEKKELRSWRCKRKKICKKKKYAGEIWKRTEARKQSNECNEDRSVKNNVSN